MLLTPQKRYEIIALSWGKLPIERIAKLTKLEEPYIHTIVMRIRQHGIKLPRIKKPHRVPSKRGVDIDYQKIKQLLRQANAK